MNTLEKMGVTEMKWALTFLWIMVFIAGCVSSPVQKEMQHAETGVFGPAVKKFCVVGPGFENSVCVKDFRDVETGEAEALK